MREVCRTAWGDVLTEGDPGDDLTDRLDLGGEPMDDLVARVRRIGRDFEDGTAAACDPPVTLHGLAVVLFAAAHIRPGLDLCDPGTVSRVVRGSLKLADEVVAALRPAPAPEGD